MDLTQYDNRTKASQWGYSTDFSSYLRGNVNKENKIAKAPGADDGYYAFGEEDNRKLVESLKAKSTIRNFATLLTVTEGSEKIYVSNSDDDIHFIKDGDPIDLKSGANDFTKLSIKRNKLAVINKLPTSFVNDSGFNVSKYLMNNFTDDFAKAEDDAFINGNGAYEPYGILHDTKGASIGKETSSLTFDDITDLFFSVDKKYRQNAVFMMNDKTALALRKLKDEDGNYLWNNNDSTIFGKQVIINNAMPDIEEGKKPILFGDFKYYWIIIRSDIGVRVLKETYAISDQIGYLAIEYLDGLLIKRDAIKALKVTAPIKAEQ